MKRIFFKFSGYLLLIFVFAYSCIPDMCGDRDNASDEWANGGYCEDESAEKRYDEKLRTGKLQKSTESVEAVNAGIVDVYITMGMGILNVRSGSEGLLDVKLGAGDVDIDLEGNKTIRNVEMDMGVGNADINLSGIDHDMEADIKGGIGGINIILPHKVGVIVKAKKGLGEIHHYGLKKIKKRTYVNAAYDSSDVVIKLNVTAGVGEINLKVEE